MRKSKFSTFLLLGALLAAVVLLPGCSVNVKKEPNGQDKQVDIKTFAGGIRVSNDADASDTGLTVYPGAHLKAKDSGNDNKSANVNLSGFGYSLKVVALEYESDAAPAKVLAFYKDQLKKYGTVLECHTAHLNLDMKTGSHDSRNDSNELTCEGDHGSNIELKVGKKYDQHIVAVEPEGKGSSFSLVYVRTHGKEADI
ncbi:MAG TPA: hypothetical protein VN310_02405 [Candidatus Dormibacteraeota bacterium]|jgi:hypothetical protein|nr:hypothetical protein [Candidatus Dormibacteraeota bacterium]